jgi:hypothetical protein
MVTEHITKSWKAYKKNYKSLLIGYAIPMIIMWVTVGIALIPFFFMGFSTAFEEVSTFEDIKSLFTGTNLIYIISAGIIVLIGYIIGLILMGGYIKVAHDALKGKANWRAMIDAAKLRWKSILAVQILMALIGVILISPALYLMYLFITTMSFVLVAWFLLALFVAMLILLFFALSLFGVVLSDMYVTDSIRNSIRIVKRNFLEFIMLMILTSIILMIISFLLGLIPIIGSLISAFIIGPFAVLIQTSFYTSKYKRR